jgi:dsDNA-specific endonuclease/ATPase MutS2
MYSSLLNILKACFGKGKPATATPSIIPDSPFEEAVVLPLEDSIDLHPFSPKDVPSVVQEYLEQCLEHGLQQVRIIHGRGTGVQRSIVQSILARHSRVVCFRDAPPEAGGWGATVVTLAGKTTLPSH